MRSGAPGSPAKAPPSRLRAPSAPSGLRQPGALALDTTGAPALRRPGFTTGAKEDKSESPPKEAPKRPSTAPSSRARAPATGGAATGGDGSGGGASKNGAVKEPLSAKVGMTGMGLSLAAPSVPASFTIDLTQLKKTYNASDLRITISVRLAASDRTAAPRDHPDPDKDTKITQQLIRRSDGARDLAALWSPGPASASGRCARV